MRTDLATGSTAFLVESKRSIREVKIIAFNGTFYTVGFDNGGGIRVRRSRLHKTKEEAEKELKSNKRMTPPKRI